jgi:hypothetical protein
MRVLTRQERPQDAGIPGLAGMKWLLILSIVGLSRQE